MSKYDELRKAMGLQPEDESKSKIEQYRAAKGLDKQNISSSNDPISSSKYNDLRMDMGIIPDTRPKVSNPTPTPVDNTKGDYKMSDLIPKYEAAKPLNLIDSVIKQGEQKQKQDQQQRDLAMSQIQNMTPEEFKMNSFNNVVKQTEKFGSLKPETEYQKRMRDIEVSNLPAPIKESSKYLTGLFYDTEPGKFISRVGSMPDYIMSGGNPVTVRPELESATANKIADILGSGLALAAPTGAPIGSGPIAAPYNAVDNVIATSPKLQKAESAIANTLTVGGKIKPQTAQAVTREVMREGAAGSLQGPAAALMMGQPDNKELAESALYGAVGGAALGGAIPLVAQPIKTAMNNRRVGQALMEGINNTELPTVPTSRIISQADVSPGMQVDNYFNNLMKTSGPTIARVSKGASLETILNDIKPVVIERMTPPLESPRELSKWIQSNMGGDIPLNEIRKMDYVQMSNLANDIKNNMNLEQVANQVANEMGYDLQRALRGPRNISPDALQRGRESLRMREVAGAPDIVRRPNILSEVQSRDVQSLVEPVTTPKITEPPIARVTEQVSQEPIQRGFASTLRASEKAPKEFSQQLNSTYTPITNAETVQKANVRISDDVNEATRFVLSDSRFDADKSVMAQRLIDHYNQKGNYQMAVSVADKVATEATKAGQAIQALSIYNKLTPEGILIHAKQLANKVNENAPKFAKEAVITEKMAADLTDLAATTQKMTGVKNLSNDVMDILDRAKSGEKLTSVETDQLKRFVNESKQFIKETTKPPKPPKAPAQPKDKRVREAVTTFLDAQEQAAKERLRSRGVQVSSMPLDIWADYAVIGAAKMGKGVVKFADWSEAMVKELGEEIRPMLNQLYDRARETFETSTKKVSKQTISNAERLTEKIIKTKEIAPEEAEQLMNLAQRVSGLSGEEKRLASQDLQAILQQLDRPTTLKKISTAQTMGQLLNPKTHVRNVVGNELFYRVERLNKLLSTPIDIARSKLTGGERYVTFKTNNQGQFWKNFMEGAKAGWRGVNINGLQTQFDLASQAFRGKYNPLAYMEKTLGAALRGFDNAAYMRAYNNTLGEIGTLDAINRGIKPTKEYVQKFISKADDNIIQIADEYGKYVTFQDNNALSKALSATKRGLNFQKDFGIGDLILKYPKTPGALLMRALEYSPAGFLRSASILAKPILKKGAEAAPAEVTQALTRAIIGTFGFSGLGYFLLDKGIITGDASRDKDIRNLEQAAGKGAYQVNLSALKRFVESGFNPDNAKILEGDLLYTYDWAQPVSVGIAMGANMRGSKDSNTAAGLGMNLLNNVSSGVNTLTDQSVLQGIARAAEGYPGQTVSDKILDVLSEVPSSFTPSMLNQIKQLMDNTRRETYSPNKLEQSLNKAQAKIPGLAQQLPAQFDTLGNEKQTYQDNNLFNVLLNPGFPSRYKLSPEAKMIVDLITETGDETLAPRVPGKSVQGNKLTGEQFSRLSQLQGEETKKRLSKIDPDSKTTSKVKKVQKALTKSSEKAKKNIIKEYELNKVEN